MFLLKSACVRALVSLLVRVHPCMCVRPAGYLVNNSVIGERAAKRDDLFLRCVHSGGGEPQPRKKNKGDMGEGKRIKDGMTRVSRCELTEPTGEPMRRSEEGREEGGRRGEEEMGM